MSDYIELARRAVACKGWRWMPGMLVRYPTGYSERIEDDTDAAARLEDDGFPDLSDPATVGCLLALVREAWGDPLMQVMNAGGGWVGFRPAPIWTDKEGCYETEAEALAAALEAAP